jgi:L-aminopeptidase/D-esterase-like protein
MFDGDTIFAMSTGTVQADLSAVGALAARAMERAVVAAIENAEPLCGLLCCADLRTK